MIKSMVSELSTPREDVYLIKIAYDVIIIGNLVRVLIPVQLFRVEKSIRLVEPKSLGIILSWHLKRLISTRNIHNKSHWRHPLLFSYIYREIRRVIITT